MSVDIIPYIEAHMAQFWFVVGFALLMIEAFVLGLSTGVLLFIGTGAILTGLLMQIGVLHTTWVVGISGTGISTVVITALLWRPFQKLRSKREEAPLRNSTKTAMDGMRFVLTSNINQTQFAEHDYSGITWKVILDPEAPCTELTAGTLVEVSNVQVGTFLVIPVDKNQTTA